MLHTANGSGVGNFGPYRRVRLLGSGGMGTVYLAERHDGEIKQKVAVKLLSGNRPAWRERFLTERRLLASQRAGDHHARSDDVHARGGRENAKE